MKNIQESQPVILLLPEPAADGNFCILDTFMKRESSSGKRKTRSISNEIFIFDLETAQNFRLRQAGGIQRIMLEKSAGATFLQSPPSSQIPQFSMVQWPVSSNVTEIVRLRFPLEFIPTCLAPISDSSKFEWNEVGLLN